MKREILTDDEMMDKYGDWKILRVYATSNSSRCGYRMTEEDGKKVILFIMNPAQEDIMKDGSILEKI